MSKSSNVKYIIGIIGIAIVIAAIYFAVQKNGSGGQQQSTTLVNSAYTTAISSLAATSQATSTINSINSQSCGSLEVSVPTPNTTENESCTWGGGNITISRSTGETTLLIYTITAHYSNNPVYVKNMTTYRIPANSTCTETLASKYLPSGNYNLQVSTYQDTQSDSCGVAFVKFTG